MCQCNCHNDPEAEQEVYNVLFALSILMADSRKEKENEKMGKITISDCACKKFEDFRVGECFIHMEKVYMKVLPATITLTAVNLETGELETFAWNTKCAPIHEFHWTDKK